MDRLYRSRSDRMLAGVAGGLAELWDADPSLVRIVWALLVVFTGGIALLVYIIMAIVVPEEEDVYPGGVPMAEEPPAVDPVTGAPVATPPVAPASGALWAASPADSRRAQRVHDRAARRAARGAPAERGGVPGAVIGGLVLVALGVFFLARAWLPAFDFDWFWPAILIGIGILLLIGAFGRQPSPPPPPPTPPVAPPTSPPDPSGGAA